MDGVQFLDNFYMTEKLKIFMKFLENYWNFKENSRNLKEIFATVKQNTFYYMS